MINEKARCLGERQRALLQGSTQRELNVDAFKQASRGNVPTGKEKPRRLMGIRDDEAPDTGWSGKCQRGLMAEARFCSKPSMIGFWPSVRRGPYE